MAISITLTSNITNNQIAQTDLPEIVNLSASAVDSNNPGALFNFSWYILDLPVDSTAILTSAGGATTSFTADEWGTYRIFCIAENQATGETSNTNPFAAPLNSFIDISVLSQKYELEKPAKSQRNWHDKYWHLVDTVENLSNDSATFLASGVSQIASPYHTAKGSGTVSSASGEDYLVLSADSFYQALLPTAGGSVPTSADNLMRERLKDVALEQIQESSINELADVVITTPTNNQVLKYNGTNWINATGGGGVEALADLTDVDVTAEAEGKYLRYDESESKWVAADASPVVLSLDELSDVQVSGGFAPSVGDALVYNALSGWIPGTVSISEAGEGVIGKVEIATVTHIATVAGPGDSASGTASLVVATEQLYDVLSSNDANGNLGLGVSNTLRDAVKSTALEQINESSINELSDVNVSSPLSNQFLRYNFASSQWTNQTVTLPSYLDDLSDVSVSGSTANQFLRFNNSTLQWTNQTADLDVLSDVTLSTPSTRQVLKYNGTGWVNGAAVDGLSSDASTTITTGAGYKIVPAATGQDLGSTGARWDVFGQTGNFAGNVTITGSAIFQNEAYIDDGGAGNLLINAGGATGTGGGGVKLKTDTVIIEPTVKTANSNPDLVFINENSNEFTISPQGKTVVNTGWKLPSTIPASGQYLQVDSLSGNDAVLEYTNITFTSTFNAYVDTSLSNFPSITFNGTTDGSAAIAGVPAYASACVCVWKNTTGRSIALTNISAMCLNQRSLSATFAVVKSTSDANMRDSNFFHIGTQFNMINNSGVDNTLGCGVGSASIAGYVIPNGYWIGIVKISNGHTDTQTNFQLSYTNAI